MKRDLDLVRDLLLECERLEPGFVLENPLEIGTFSAEDVAGHVRLCLNAELVEGRVDDTLDDEPTSWAIERLTWKGHEYLDSVRSDTVWSSVKQTAKEKGLSLTLDIAQTLAVAKIRAVLNLPPA